MIQRFIELGEGYSDIYELFEIAQSNHYRLAHLMILNSTKEGKSVVSFLVILHPAAQGEFQPLYLCREGIVRTPEKTNKRIELFEELATKLDKEIISLDVKPSTIFAEKELYYQYLTGILRMNRFIPFMK